MTFRDEALKALDDIFNYCEEIDYSLPENERSGYKMLPDVQKIRKYIIENTRPHGEWIQDFTMDTAIICSKCGEKAWYKEYCGWITKSNFCPNCGADMRKKEGEQNEISRLHD